MALQLLMHSVMNTRRIARLALALVAFAAATSSSLVHAEIAPAGKSSAGLSVGVTVLSKCSVEAEDDFEVHCEQAQPPRVEQSAVYTLQIDGQQASFTTNTVNF